VNSKLRILIAEDDHGMREFVIGLLKTEFDVVGAVTTGRQLVSRALELIPDVIVSDTSMPMLGGVTAMNELRSAGFDIPVVLISAVFRRAGVSRHPGALVYVDKTDLEADLISGVRRAKAGQAFLSRSIPASE
jgi:DNA-binding NarL/FixJ family response regulator